MNTANYVHMNTSVSLCFCSDRAGSISTLDSLDFARYSDDGNRESDERVAGKMRDEIHVGGVETKQRTHKGSVKDVATVSWGSCLSRHHKIIMFYSHLMCTNKLVLQLSR